MPIKVVTDVSEFEHLRERWNALVETSAYPNIFTTWEWSFLWWKHFGQTVGRCDGTLFILLVESDTPDGELLAIFPLYRTGNGRFLYWIGYGARPCPEYLGPVIRHDAIDISVQTVCDFLLKDAGNWDRFFFEDYSLDDSGTSAFARLLKHQLPYQAVPGESRYYIHLPDSYDAYLKTLSSHNRGKKKNRLNQSKSRHNATAEVVTLTELERGFSALVDLTTQSRKRIGQASPFARDDYHAFHKDVLETLLPLNRATIFLLNYSDTPVGVWYAYSLKHKSYGYQQGCASDCPGSPGDVTLQNFLIHLIDNQMTEFDFLRGGEWYKSAYTETMRETETLSVYRMKNIVFFRDRIVTQILKPIKRSIKLLIVKLFKAMQRGKQGDQIQ